METFAIDTESFLEEIRQSLLDSLTDRKNDLMKKYGDELQVELNNILTKFLARLVISLQNTPEYFGKKLLIELRVDE